MRFGKFSIFQCLPIVSDALFRKARGSSVALVTISWPLGSITSHRNLLHVYEKTPWIRLKPLLMLVRSGLWPADRLSFRGSSFLAMHFCSDSLFSDTKAKIQKIYTRSFHMQRVFSSNKRKLL